VSVLYETAHYKVHYIGPPDEDTYPTWGITDLSENLVFVCSLNKNFGAPYFQAKDICDSLEEAYMRGFYA
jgi:hypothetical protein